MRIRFRIMRLFSMLFFRSFEFFPVGVLMFVFSPARPEMMDWSEHYPAYFAGGSPGERTGAVEVADIGCGYGGLLFALSPRLPQMLMLGTLCCFSFGMRPA